MSSRTTRGCWKLGAIGCRGASWNKELDDKKPHGAPRSVIGSENSRVLDTIACSCFFDLLHSGRRDTIRRRRVRSRDSSISAHHIFRGCLRFRAGLSAAIVASLLALASLACVHWRFSGHDRRDSRRDTRAVVADNARLDAGGATANHARAVPKRYVGRREDASSEGGPAVEMTENAQGPAGVASARGETGDAKPWFGYGDGAETGVPPGGDVPVWVRPSTEELEEIVRAQFGPWRTLSDAAPRAGVNASATASTQGQVGRTGGCTPMQQGMPPYQEKDLYRCYDEMRKEYQFGTPLRQVGVVTVGGNKEVKASPRGVVTLMSTSRSDDIMNLKKALRALSKNFLRKHAYPVAIIHEDFSTHLMESLRGSVPVPIHFVEVEFKLPDWMEPLSWIYPLAVKHFTGHPSSKPVVGFHSDMHGMLPYVKRGSFGYFHMCRFFGGAGYMLPFFDDFDFYLRIDSDSVCDRPLPDYFRKLEEADADYAYDSTFLDYGEKAQGLWNFADKYMHDHNVTPTFWNIPEGAGTPFKALATAKRRQPYPSCSDKPLEEENVVSIQGTQIHSVPCQDRHFQAVPAFYTNFEVARIEMLRSSWYQDWFNAIDKTGSIYFNRWGDAPIRFMGLAMHLPENKILQVNGCFHK